MRDPRAELARLAALPAERTSLGEAALWIAAEEYPELDVARELARLAHLAERARPSVSAAPTVRAKLERLAEFLHSAERFDGNQSDFYDPKNSFLNEVIERRTGIPITLAIVWIEVGRKLGLPLFGVGFPGHFLVRAVGERRRGEDLIIDPFAGQLLTRLELENRWRAAAGEATPFDPAFLEPTPPARILARVLSNLKQIWLAREDWLRALACCERILLVAPDSIQELRDRGLLYARLECVGAALADLRRFLELAPDDPTAEAVRARLLELARAAPSVH